MAAPGTERTNVALHAERVAMMLRGTAEEVPANDCSRVISGSTEDTARWPYVEQIREILESENGEPLAPDPAPNAYGIYAHFVSHDADGNFPQDAFGLVRVASFAGVGTERVRDGNQLVRLQVQFVMRHRRGAEIVLNRLHNAAYGILAGAFVAWPGQTQPMGDGGVPVGEVDTIAEATATRGSRGALEGWIYSSQVWRFTVKSIVNSVFQEPPTT